VIKCTTSYEYGGVTASFEYTGETKEEVERKIHEQFLTESSMLLTVCAAEGRTMIPIDVVFERNWNDGEEIELVSTRLPLEDAHVLERPGYVHWMANVQLMDGRWGGMLAIGDRPKELLIAAIERYIPGWYFRNFRTPGGVVDSPDEVSVHLTFEDGSTHTIKVTKQQAVSAMLAGELNTHTKRGGG
jgi:hypothetical protein